VAALDLGRDKHLVLVGDARLGPGRAPYTRLGDILGWVMLALFVFSVAFPVIVRRQVKKAAQQGGR
jgi:apolipoprotein N-acyltransferase